MKLVRIENKIQMYEVLSWLLMTAAFIYTILRAWYLPIAHDEANSYFEWVSASLRDILLYNSFELPNNHLLNTLLIKIFVYFFGLSEFVIRIPALIGHALYLVGIYKTLKLFLKDGLVVVGLCVLIFNPFMLQMFAMGRGYALSLGFSSIGTYYLLRYIKELYLPRTMENSSKEESLHIGWSFLMFALATMSSFSFFHIYLSAFVWLAGHEIATKRSRWKLITSIFPSFLLLISTCLLPVIKIYIFHPRIAELGEKGLWANTVLSLISKTLYHQTYSLPWLPQSIQFFIIGVIILAVVLAMIRLRLKDNVLQQTLILLRCVGAWLMICCLIIIGEGGMLKFGYSSGRTAIYFIPLFYLLFLLVIQCLALLGKEIKQIRIGIYCFVILFSVISTAHFAYCANLKHCYGIQAYCESSRDVIKYLMQSHKMEHLQSQSVSIGTHRDFTPMLNFYMTKYNVQWLKPLPYYHDLRDNFDYYFLSVNNDGFVEKHEMDSELMAASHDKGLEVFFKVLKVFPDGTRLLYPRLKVL